jgi:hypothetical protein
MTDDTLQAAKKELRDNWKEGVGCQCCGQLVKLYSRKVSGRSAASLIKLYQLWRKDAKYYHVEKLGCTGSGGDFARLERYGLISCLQNDDTSKRTSGLWIPTQKGIDFVEGRIKIKSHILMFNQKTFGFEGAEISIKSALGNKFNYAVLMGWEDE